MIIKIGIALMLSLTCSMTFGQPKSKRHYAVIKFESVGESKEDTLEFKGKVKSIYKCPPCPEGAQCKPCIGDHIEVTDGNKEHDFRVFTNQFSLFKVGNSYRFLVRFRSKLHRIDNIQLVRVLE